MFGAVCTPSGRVCAIANAPGVAPRAYGNALYRFCAIAACTVAPPPTTNIDGARGRRRRGPQRRAMRSAGEMGGGTWSDRAVGGHRTHQRARRRYSMHKQPNNQAFGGLSTTNTTIMAHVVADARREAAAGGARPPTTGWIRASWVGA